MVSFVHQKTFDHGGFLSSIGVLADAQRTQGIVTGGGGNAKLWDMNGVLVQTVLYQGQNNNVETSACSDTGEVFIGTTSGHWELWKSDGTSPLLKRYGGSRFPLTKGIGAAAFSPDGNTFVTASWDHTARLLSKTTGQELQCLRGHKSYVYRVAFSPDGQLVATYSLDRDIRVWNVTTGNTKKTLSQGDCKGMAFSINGTELFAASETPNLTLWNTSTWTSRNVPIANVGDCLSVAPCPTDGNEVAVGSSLGIVIFDRSSGWSCKQFISTSNGIVRLAYAGDGNTIVASESGRQVNIYSRN